MLKRMHIKIQIILFRALGPPMSEGDRRTIPGGVSAEDVLQDAFEALLEHAATKSEDRSDEWMPLAIRIAANKAKDALERAFKGLRGTEHRPELKVISADSLAPHEYEHPDPSSNPEEAAIEICQAEQLSELARELLDDDELFIFTEIGFKGRTRTEVGKELGRTGQRIGQKYEQIARRIENHPRYPYTSDQ